MDEHRGRNLRLYPAYVACLNGFFWFPVFFLYLTSRVGIENALFLEAVYYLAVVAFELPSGWVSDRIGRRFALRSSALLLLAAYIAFYLGDSIVELGIAQVLLAAGFAFNSGTDTSFHYDSLRAAGLEHEYGAREERIARLTFAVVGVTGLIGGAVAMIELQLAYLLSAVVAAIGFVVTLMFERLERASEDVAERLDQQLLACVGDLKDPMLAWLFGCSVLLTVAIHVPYQLYQPYLDLLDLSSGAAPTPLLTGIHAFAAMVVASLLSGWSVRWARRVGIRGALLASLAWGVLLIGLLAAFLHPVVALLLVLRSAPKALMQAPLNAAITPRIPAKRRASYLSVQSLAGRLSFSLLLFALSFAVSGDDAAADVQTAALLSAAATGIVWLVLLATSRAIRGEDADAALASAD
jgi:MFS family permease